MVFATSRDRGGFFDDWGVTSGPISTNTDHIFPPKASPPERRMLKNCFRKVKVKSESVTYYTHILLLQKILTEMKILQYENVTSGPISTNTDHILPPKASPPERRHSKEEGCKKILLQKKILTEN